MKKILHTGNTESLKGIEGERLANGKRPLKTIAFNGTTETQETKHATVIATYRLNRPVAQFSEKDCKENK